MDTNPDLAAGTTLASTSPTDHPQHHTARAQTHHTGLGTGGHDLRRLLVYKAYIRSGLMEPFRILLRPLRKWLLQPHVAIHAGEGDPELVDLPLRRPSTTTLVLSIILGPLVFVMLLPLLLILVPLALVIGFAAVVITTFKVNDDNLGQPIHVVTPAPR